MINTEEIITNIKLKNNIILYNENVYNYYNKLSDEFDCIYLKDPVPIKKQLIEIIEKISDYKKSKLNRMTVSDLKNLLVEQLDDEFLVIMFNRFEKITKKAVEVYVYINNNSNIIFLASFNGKFNKDAYFFFKKFKILNKDEYKEKNKDTINVTYPLYIFISVICFAVYLKFGLSLGILGTLYYPIVILGAIWFAFLVFRTLTYVGGRV